MSSHQHYFTPEFAKINIEGYEAQLIPSLGEKLLKMDVIIELHDTVGSSVVYDTAQKYGLNLYSHKIGFDRINSKDQMPVTNKEGYVIISNKSKTNWFEDWTGI